MLKTDLFDEAVGVGLYPELAARAERVVGIDLSARAVSIASERYPEMEAQVADVLALPFPDGSFDAVFSNSTLDHFRSHRTLRAALSELARTIRPGGRFIVTLDNRMNPVVALRTSFLFGTLHRLNVVPYFVGATYGPRGLRRILRETGFDVRDIRAIMHCPPQLAAHWAVRRAWSAPGSDQQPEAHLRRVMRLEALEQSWVAPLTGHFVGALALKR